MKLLVGEVGCLVLFGRCREEPNQVQRLVCFIWCFYVAKTGLFLMEKVVGWCF